MAEDIQGTAKGPNGEQLSLQLGTRSFAVTSRDLISVLLVLVMGVGFYLTVDSLTDRMDRLIVRQDEGFRKFETLLELAHRNQTTILTALRDNRDLTADMLGTQNTLRATETGHLVEVIQGQTLQLRQWLGVIVHRLHYPDQPVSLDLPPDPPRR